MAAAVPINQKPISRCCIEASCCRRRSWNVCLHFGRSCCKACWICIALAWWPVMYLCVRKLCDLATEQSTGRPRQQHWPSKGSVFASCQPHSVHSKYAPAYAALCGTASAFHAHCRHPKIWQLKYCCCAGVSLGPCAD